MADPLINPGEDGENLTYTSVFEDNFAGTSGGPGPNWKYIDMTDGLHRSGNKDLDADGTYYGEDSGVTVSGKRHAAWYNHPNPDSFTYRSGGSLKMGGVTTSTPDPTRDNYFYDDYQYNWGDEKWYTAFLTTWDRVGSNPDLTWGPGHFFEMEVDFSGMKTKSFRFSWWLMPSAPNESDAYDGNAANGVEIDMFEYENWVDDAKGYVTFDPRDALYCKVIAGAAGQTPNDLIDVSNPPIYTGIHKIGLLWETDRLVWYVDGTEVQRDQVRVPQVPHYMLMTREINAGVYPSGQPRLIPEVKPYRPSDYGLQGRSAYQDKAKVNTDQVKVYRVQVWSTDPEVPPPPPPPEPPPPIEEAQTNYQYIADRSNYAIEYQLEGVNGASFTASAYIPTNTSYDDHTYSWTLGTGLSTNDPLDGYQIKVTFDTDLADGAVADRTLQLTVNPV